MLRKHQAEFSEVIDGICEGSGVRTIYGSVTPGGGKSLLPVVAGRLIQRRLADKLMWIAPRLSLTDQAEREFLNPRFRNLLGHRLTIRTSTNEPDPCRGLNGFATTYQAMGQDNGILAREFIRSRYILCCDEFHHVAQDSLWHQRLEPLFHGAAFRVMMSGTLERGDGQRIALMPYEQRGPVLAPDLRNTADTAVIRYTRADALAEQAILPLQFHLSDGRARWMDADENLVEVQSLDRAGKAQTAQALFTALSTEFAEELLEAGLTHWIEHRRRVFGARCLIVTSNIRQAKRHMQALEGLNLGIRAAVATSEDSADALKAILAMKKGRLDVLVTVAMCYEGLDIPAVSHVICLTRYRSAPWIEQMAARANRIDPGAGPYEQQMGHVFAPADPLMKEIVRRIEAEQMPVLKQRERMEREAEEAGEREGFALELSPGGIVPLSSALTGSKQVMLGGRRKGAEIMPESMPERTPSEIEAELLEHIECHIRLYSFQNRYNPKKLNGEVFEAMGKPRREMTIAELERCLLHVRTAYPLGRVRGTGIPRVPTKAEPARVEWRG